MFKACTECPLRATCQSPCPEVEQLLPDEQHGRAHALHRRNAAEAARRLEAERHAARLMTDFRHVLRGRARQVFDMTYNDMLPQDEIATRLGIARRVVSHYLVRARHKIAEHLASRPR
jgi:DNA-directed RNA polymerase specialized sigma subunit